MDHDAQFLDVAAEALNEAANNLRADNDGADFQQQRDLEEREALAMQALTTIAAAGFTSEADILAIECGLWPQWKAPVKVVHATPWP